MDRKLQQIFDAPVLHVDVDFDPAAVHAFEADDRAARGHRRARERIASTCSRYVSPSEPSTMAVKRVFSGTGGPPASTWNFGVSVVP